MDFAKGLGSSLGFAFRHRFRRKLNLEGMGGNVAVDIVVAVDTVAAVVVVAVVDIVVAVNIAAAVEGFAFVALVGAATAAFAGIAAETFVEA